MDICGFVSEIVTHTARIDKLAPSCSIIFVKNKILECKEAKDPTKDILHSSDLLLILILVNFLHPTKKLLHAMRYIDSKNGYIYPDTFFDPPRNEVSPPSSPNGLVPSDEDDEESSKYSDATSEKGSFPKRSMNRRYRKGKRIF